MTSSDGFRINISDKEASAEGGSSELLPRGDYHVKCTDGEIKQVVSNDKGNQGKPFYNLEFTIQDGPHAGRKLFDSAMLFDGALYTIVQIMKAMGLTVTEGEMVVPSIADIMGRDFVAGVRKQPAKGEYDERNVIKSYMPFDPSKGVTTAAGKTKSSLMP